MVLGFKTLTVTLKFCELNLWELTVPATRRTARPTGLMGASSPFATTAITQILKRGRDRLVLGWGLPGKTLECCQLLQLIPPIHLQIGRGPGESLKLFQVPHIQHLHPGRAMLRQTIVNTFSSYRLQHGPPL